MINKFKILILFCTVSLLILSVLDSLLFYPIFVLVSFFSFLFISISYFRVSKIEISKKINFQLNDFLLTISIIYFLILLKYDLELTKIILINFILFTLGWLYLNKQFKTRISKKLPFIYKSKKHQNI